MERQQNMHHVTRIDAFLHRHLKTPSLRLSTDWDCSQLSVDKNTWKQKKENKITLPLIRWMIGRIRWQSCQVAMPAFSSGAKDGTMKCCRVHRGRSLTQLDASRETSEEVCLSAAWVPFASASRTKTHKIFFLYFNHDDNRIFNLPSAFFLAKPGKSWEVPV